jgi:hypothetical protein
MSLSESRPERRGIAVAVIFMLVGLCTIVRGDNNEDLLVSWYWYILSMNVGATKVYMGSV